MHKESGYPPGHPLSSKLKLFYDAIERFLGLRRQGISKFSACYIVVSAVKVFPAASTAAVVRTAAHGHIPSVRKTGIVASAVASPEIPPSGLRAAAVLAAARAVAVVIAVIFALILAAAAASRISAAYAAVIAVIVAVAMAVTVATGPTAVAAAIGVSGADA